MVRQLFGLAVAGAVLFGTASTANAQFAVSVGNPYTGQSFAISGGATPYGYGVTSYSGGYPVYGAPSVYVSTPYTTYSSGYSVPPVVTTPRTTTYTTTSYVPPAPLPAPTYTTSYVAPPVTYYPRTYYTPTVVRTYAAPAPGYYVYRPGIVGRAMRGVFGGVNYYPY
jgi:hypothetical protein